MTRIVMNTDSLQATAAQMRAVAGEYDALGAQLAGEALPAMPADTAEYVQAGFDQARTTLQQLATELDTEASTLDWRVSMALEEGGFSAALDPLSSVMQAQQQMASVWTQPDPFDAALAGLAAAPIGIASAAVELPRWPATRALAAPPSRRRPVTARSGPAGAGTASGHGVEHDWRRLDRSAERRRRPIVQPGQQTPAPPPGMVWSTIGGDSIDPLSGGDVQIVPGTFTVGGDTTGIDVAGDWSMSGSDIFTVGGDSSFISDTPSAYDLINAAGNNPQALDIVSSVLRSQARDAAIWTAPDNVGILSVW